MKDLFGGSRKERREHNKGISSYSGHTYQSRQKRKEKIAKASRRYNRMIAKGKRV